MANFSASSIEAISIASFTFSFDTQARREEIRELRHKKRMELERKAEQSRQQRRKLEAGLAGEGRTASTDRSNEP